MILGYVILGFFQNWLESLWLIWSLIGCSFIYVCEFGSCQSYLLDYVFLVDVCL